MTTFREIVNQKLTECKLYDINTVNLLVEGFRIDNSTRTALRELYKSITRVLEYNNKIIKNKNDQLSLAATYEVFEKEFRRIAILLSHDILDNAGTDELHDSIFRNIRSLIANNPTLAKELENASVAKNTDAINSTKGLSDQAKKLLKLETALYYVRYIGAIRSYLGFGYKNEINPASVVGKYRDNLEKGFKENNGELIVKTIDEYGKNVLLNLEGALEALAHLGRNAFPKNKGASVD